MNLHAKDCKLKESRNRPGVAQRIPGGLGSQISWHSAHEDGEVVSLTHRPDKGCADVQFTLYILSLNTISLLNTFFSTEQYLVFYLIHRYNTSHSEWHIDVKFVFFCGIRNLCFVSYWSVLFVPVNLENNKIGTKYMLKFPFSHFLQRHGS